MTWHWTLLVALAAGIPLAGAAPPGGDRELGKLGIVFDRSKGGGDTGSMRFGLHLLTETGKATGKKLTFDAQGLTNNTCVRLDGKESLLGHPPGKWRVEAEALGGGRGG